MIIKSIIALRFIIILNGFLTIIDFNPIGLNIHSVIIREGDVFLVQINVNDMMKFKDEMNVLLLTDVKMNQQELMGKNHVIVEGIIPQ